MAKKTLKKSKKLQSTKTLKAGLFSCVARFRLARLINLESGAVLKQGGPIPFKCSRPCEASLRGQIEIAMKPKKTKNTLRKPKKLEETKPLSRAPWLNPSK